MRPRERLLREGAARLSDRDLLAIILRVGGSGKNALELAEEMLVCAGGVVNLTRAQLKDLMAHKGIGEAKACEIKAAFELGRRAHNPSPLGKTPIGGPEDLAALVMSEMRHLDREQLRVVCLDTKNQVTKIELISIGTLNASLAHPRECFKPAVAASAASVVFVHNHPSGDPTPSAEDVALTKSLMRAGELLGIEVVDHLVIGDGRYASLRERGLL